MVRRQASLEDKLREIKNLPAITLDGKRIILSANIEKAGDSEAVKCWRGGRGLVPHGISIHQSRFAADGGGAIPVLPRVAAS